ncbi:hypothetical protein PEC18_37900 [Paucibacter sp. O1-1]|nr:hypothetical protein [Paucibacter sp. O1-1]MDA3831402.1 hypothetical protein [Paucibacter sp. O1-1]
MDRLLAGCSLFDPKTDPQAGSNLVPRVTLKGDEIVIQPEVLRYRKSEGLVTITWRLDARSGVTLADPAVVIEDPRRKPLAPEPALAKLCPVWG